MTEKEMMEKIEKLEKRIESLEKEISIIKEDMYIFVEEEDEDICGGHCSHCNGCED